MCVCLQISKRTQTDNSSLASLDRDNYESERLRSEMDEENFEDGDGYHGLTNVDEGVEGMTSSATICWPRFMSPLTHRSKSSPYVLCFECSDEFLLER